MFSVANVFVNKRTPPTEIVSDSVRALLGLMDDNLLDRFVNSLALGHEHDSIASFAKSAKDIAVNRPTIVKPAKPMRLTLGERLKLLQFTFTPAYKQLTARYGRLDVAAFDLDRLLISQSWIYDAHYVNPDRHVRSLTELCFGQSMISNPLISEEGCLLFRSYPSQTIDVSRLNFARKGRNVYLSLIVSPRPNVMKVSRLDEDFVLTNGHHRAAFLFVKNISRVVCFIAHEDFREDTSLSKNGLLSASTIRLTRPRVKDFFSDAIMKRVAVRRSRNELQLSVRAHQRRLYGS